MEKEGNPLGKREWSELGEGKKETLVDEGGFRGPTWQEHQELCEGEAVVDKTH